MKDYEAIKALLNESNGFLTASQVTAAGIQRRTLSELVAAKLVCRVARGIYALPETWEDEMFLIQYRFSKGIFSHGTALYLHDLSDRTPINFTLTFPQGYNATGLKRYNAKAKFVIPDIYNIGITERPSPIGNPLHVYDAERTLCDIVKGKNALDIQLVNHAMKAYVKSKSIDMQKLLAYAERLRVKPKILRYMEVLLTSFI